MAVGLRSVVERCRDRGYEPTFHHETGTYVEAPWEIARVLEISDVGLCLDTGHFFVGGGDPVAALREWSSRINHVHLKDAVRSVMDGIIADGEPTPAIWSREAFCALGAGDVDVEGVIATLAQIDFTGWLVVEQDIFPQTAQRFAQAIEDQKANRQFLARHGL
jgi:inosose dehydratase